MRLSQGLAGLGFIFLIVSNTVAQASSQRCPVITVSCPKDGVWTGTPIKFFARIDGPIPPGKPEFRWSLSAGKIIDGQGTSTITVNTDDLVFGRVIASLQVVGIGDCSTSGTCTTDIIPFCGLHGVKFDEYGALSFEDERARLDDFALQLKNQSGSQGHILVYAGRGDTSEDIETRLSRSKNYLVNNHGLDPGRVVTENGGKREELTVELYVVPIGAAPPEPQPSVPEKAAPTKPSSQRSNRD
jgi:hypothetical protein